MFVAIKSVVILIYLSSYVLAQTALDKNLLECVQQRKRVSLEAYKQCVEGVIAQAREQERETDGFGINGLSPSGYNTAIRAVRHSTGTIAREKHPERGDVNRYTKVLLNEWAAEYIPLEESTVKSLLGSQWRQAIYQNQKTWLAKLTGGTVAVVLPAVAVLGVIFLVMAAATAGGEVAASGAEPPPLSCLPFFINNGGGGGCSYSSAGPVENAERPQEECFGLYKIGKALGSIPTLPAAGFKTVCANKKMQSAVKQYQSVPKSLVRRINNSAKKPHDQPGDGAGAKPGEIKYESNPPAYAPTATAASAIPVAEPVHDDFSGAAAYPIAEAWLTPRKRG